MTAKLAPCQDTFHEDFTVDGDIELVTPSRVHFVVPSSVLARASGFFRAMFANAHPDQDPAREREVIAVEEDEQTLEILLKIVCALPYAFAQMDDMDVIERVACAADKYDVPAALQTMQLLMHAPIARPHALRRYALAARFGWDTVCADALVETLDADIDFARLPPMDMMHLARLMRLRQYRVTTFATVLDDKVIFNSGNRDTCFGAGHILRRPTAWESLKAALVLELVRRPSGKTVVSANQVFLDAAREAICPDCSPPCALYNWPDTFNLIKRALERLPTNLD